MKINILKIGVLLLLLASCKSVKEYEKIQLNDPDMSLSERDLHRYKSAFQSYREAAAGANGGKSGGGCGCN